MPKKLTNKKYTVGESQLSKTRVHYEYLPGDNIIKKAAKRIKKLIRRKK